MEFSHKNNIKAVLFFLIFILLVGFIFYWRVGTEEVPGDYQVKKANYRLEDGQYDKAVEEFTEALSVNPDHPMAHLGLAITYMQMGRNDEAFEKFDRTLSLDPSLAAAYADKGILLDRLGRYEEALANYKKALDLDAEILEGPGWLWRFMRNIDKRPPAIKERAQYLEAELKKPPEERLLQLPEEDAKQRMYKVE